jgi:soluble lytic murein transglycosylase-like protein
VIVPPSRESAAVTLFGAGANHSFFAAAFFVAVAQSIAPRRQPTPHLGLSARGGASVPTRSPSVRFVIYAASVFLCLGALFECSARAEPASIAGTASSRAALPFTAFVAEASQRFNIPGNWIRAVMRIESAGDPRAVSPNGAMGLMQIMPKTYAGLRARHHLGPDAYDPRDNILAGAAYLREMLDRYGSPGFLAAYNAGPARYDEHLVTGRPLPAETQTYVAMLSPMIGGQQFDDRTVAPFDLIAWARATLFATHAEAPPNAELPAAKVQPDRLPSIHRIVDLSALSPRSEGLFVHLASSNRAQ